MKWGACAGGLLVACAAVTPASAQDSSANQTVTVTGSAAQARRDEVSGKQVISAEDLAKHGDTRLADALRRVPGISIGGSGAELQIRLDGMSAEQTLVLLNGEPVPRGQVLEALALGMVERIEIVRGANVQWSGRGLAGTINIVTRQARSSQRDLSLALGSYFGDPTGQAELNLGDKDGAHSWRLGLSARVDRDRYPVDQEHRFTDTSGGVLSAFHVRTVEAAHDDAVTLTPQWQWDGLVDGLGDGNRKAQVQAGGVLSASRFAGAGEDLRSDVQGSPPRMQSDRLAYRHDRSFGRLNLKAAWPLGEQTRWNSSLMASRGRRDQTSVLTGNDFNGTAVRDSLVVSTRVDDLLTLRSDLQHALSAQHQLVGGMQLDGNRRQENRVQTERIVNPEPDTDERYDATSQSLAAFVQDDWLVDKTTTVSLGARLEWLQTRSTGNVFDGVHRTYRLGSPMANLLWRPQSGTQLKLGLSRAFRLPEPRDIMPRRWTRPENSSLVPDFIGNPELKPESAWTLTAGWEQRVGDGASLGLNGVLKRISDVILDELILQGNEYLLRRANYGQADVASLQVQWQGEVPAAWGGAVKLSADATARKSRLAAVPGPDNRLPGQAPWEWRVQADQQLEGTRWSWLAAWRWRAGFDAQAPTGRLLGSGPSRGLDLALTWQAGPGDRWRLSASGLASSGARESTTRTWVGGVDSYRATTEEAPRWRLQWMHRL